MASVIAVNPRLPIATLLLHCAEIEHGPSRRWRSLWSIVSSERRESGEDPAGLSVVAVGERARETVGEGAPYVGVHRPGNRRGGQAGVAAGLVGGEHEESGGRGGAEGLVPKMVPSRPIFKLFMKGVGADFLSDST
jgi:hypothetical protein